MMLNLQEIISKHGLKPTGVIHVGAHFGQEYDRYKEVGIPEIIFIEPCGPAFKQLEKNMAGKTDVTLFKLACSDVKGESMMNVEIKNEGMSNSLRKPKLHLQQYADIEFPYNELVQTDRLDNLTFDRERFNMLYMDVQGCEDMVLKGAPETLKYIDIVYTEVNRAELYEGNVMVDQLSALLKDFEQIEINWTGDTWGDAVYKRVKEAVWKSDPLNITVEVKVNGTVKENANVTLFDAINMAYAPLDSKPFAEVYFSNIGGITYVELLRLIASGFFYNITAVDISTDGPINPIPKFAIIQRAIDKEVDRKEPTPSLSDDQKTASIDTPFKINQFTKLVLGELVPGKRYLVQLFPEVKKRR